MTRPLFVHLVPQLFAPEDVQGGVVVILDILRASTTIIHALENGAEGVIPVADVEQARVVASRLTREQVLLGGEREGLLIPGFDLDNNPLAYTREVVAGKKIVFTTTNGTAALERAKAAREILIGAFVNLSAVVDKVFATTGPVHLVCAGTRWKVTLEDALCAGGIAWKLLERDQQDLFDRTDDQLQLVLDAYRNRTKDSATFRRAMRSSFGGRNCVRLGFDLQIDRAATIDLFKSVPVFDATTGFITI